MLKVANKLLNDDGNCTFSGLAWTILLTQKKDFLYAFLQMKRFYCISWGTHSASASVILLI